MTTGTRGEPEKRSGRQSSASGRDEGQSPDISHQTAARASSGRRIGRRRVGRLCRNPAHARPIQPMRASKAARAGDGDRGNRASQRTNDKCSDRGGSSCGNFRRVLKDARLHRAVTISRRRYDRRNQGLSRADGPAAPRPPTRRACRVIVRVAHWRRSRGRLPIST